MSEFEDKIIIVLREIRDELHRIRIELEHRED